MTSQFYCILCTNEKQIKWIKYNKKPGRHINDAGFVAKNR